MLKTIKKPIFYVCKRHLSLKKYEKNFKLRKNTTCNEEYIRITV